MSALSFSPSRVRSAARRYWYWAPLSLVLGPLWTAIHETAHVLAAVALLLSTARSHAISRLAFLFCVVFPIGEIGLSTFGIGSPGADLGKAFAGAGWFWAPVLLVTALGSWIGARTAFERIFETGFSRTEYAGLGLLLLGIPWIVGWLVR